MSLDFMILGALDGSRPIGPLHVVLDRAREALGIDLLLSEVEISGARLEVSLEVENGEVACIHVTPRDGDFEKALEALAGGLGAVVFDSQTGFELHAERSGLPDRVDDRYDIELVSVTGEDLGPRYEIWDRLASFLDVSRADAGGSGAGWSVRVAFFGRNDVVYGVRLRATWTDVAARDDLLARVVRTAEQNGWVPFDPQRNDTIDG